MSLNVLLRVPHSLRGRQRVRVLSGGIKNPLERRYGVATDFIGTEERVRARRMWNRGESSRTSKPAPFKNRRVRHPQKISFQVGEVEGLATRRLHGNQLQLTGV